MSSGNQSSPGKKRPHSDFLDQVTTLEPITPDNSKKLKVEDGHDTTPARLLKTNKALGEQVSSLNKTVDEQAARIAHLERENQTQRELIRVMVGAEMLDPAMAEAYKENSQSSASTEDGPTQTQKKQQQHVKDQLDRDNEGEPDTTA